VFDGLGQRIRIRLRRLGQRRGGTPIVPYLRRAPDGGFAGATLRF
jgi:hypothetical protein